MTNKTTDLYVRIVPDIKEQVKSIHVLSKEELDKEIEKGYADMQAGHTEPAEKVFADIRQM